VHVRKPTIFVYYDIDQAYPIFQILMANRNVTTRSGGQITTPENIDRIVGVFNPRWIKPGVVVYGSPQEADKI
jgi:hypothetical protein